MAFYEKKLSCTCCGTKMIILVPRGMSQLGIQAISVCDSCRKKEQAKRKEGDRGKDRPDKAD